jgi:beta-mannosidase
LKATFDLSELKWKLTGWTPHFWRFSNSIETGSAALAEVPPLPAPVPGSVQEALRLAGELPDWNVGLNARLCEWAENRHWVYEAVLPAEWMASGSEFRLNALGLDYCGSVLVNGKEIGCFKGSFTPHRFDLTPWISPETENRLQIVFECPPRWLGQFGFTSQMNEWKPRFNYTWDWTPRLVQTGIWDDLLLEATDGEAFAEVRCATDADPAEKTGILHLSGAVRGDSGSKVRILLEDKDRVPLSEEISVERFSEGVTLSGLPVDLWFPFGYGLQPLYSLRIQLLDARGELLDETIRSVGFKHVEWKPCEGAPPEADPWICEVNGRAVFLQGVNWTPIRPNFADVTPEAYAQRLVLYRDLGCNLMRVWGGAFLEKRNFYDLCDELGLMVWQEFPLSSSGVDNWPPEDEKSIAELSGIAESYVERRRHHVSLLMWCGGNELQGAMDGGKVGGGKPVDDSHPLMRRFKEIVEARDPLHRFVPTSSSGPRFYANEDEMGRGVHWDVHGPWKAEGKLEEGWTRYWSKDDALLRSETGSPGASPSDVIREYLGDCEEIPCSLDNPIWRRTAWWVEWPDFIQERGREPEDLEEYVAWSQERQARALSIAVSACKDRFPRCGGILLWMGHDSFPCTANTSILDFWGRPKPAAHAVGDIFRRKA